MAGDDIFRGAMLGSGFSPGVGTAIGAGWGGLAGLFEDVPVLGDLLDPFGLFGKTSGEKEHREALKKLQKEIEAAQKRIAEYAPKIEQARWDAMQRSMSLWEPYQRAISERYGPQYVSDLRGVFENPFAGINFGPRSSPTNDYKYNPVSTTGGVGREI